MACSGYDTQGSRSWSSWALPQSILRRIKPRIHVEKRPCWSEKSRYVNFCKIPTFINMSELLLSRCTGISLPLKHKTRILSICAEGFLHAADQSAGEQAYVRVKNSFFISLYVMYVMPWHTSGVLYCMNWSPMLSSRLLWRPWSPSLQLQAL